MSLVLDVCQYVYVLDFGEFVFAGAPGEIRTPGLGPLEACTEVWWQTNRITLIDAERLPDGGPSPDQLL
jgi:hypothetical protein